jgi:HNH endonuclease
MPEGRDDISLPLQRSLMIEAGHRCAIPTCRAVAPLVFEHIEDWVKVREHKFENMIVLCANCHGLKGEGPRKLDRKSLRQYKLNLAVVNGRYGDIERRVLEFFAVNPEANDMYLPGGLDILLAYLLIDGLLQKAPPVGGIYFGPHPMYQNYLLTSAGREFVERWADAQPI